MKLTTIGIIVAIIFWIVLSFTGIKSAHGLSVSAGWHKVEPYHFVYAAEKSVIAEVWADTNNEDGAVWYWIVYLKTDIMERPYMGKECCKDEAFKEANFIMDGGYWT